MRGPGPGLRSTGAELRREEMRRQREADREQFGECADAGEADSEEQVFRAYLEGEARESFQQVAQRLVQTDQGRKSREDAEESGEHMHGTLP